MDQDAPKNGAMFFELSSLGGRTHAGVLDFTAPAGTVVLPRKACRGRQRLRVHPPAVIVCRDLRSLRMPHTVL